LLVLASLALCSNYILYLSGLERLSPSVATVVIQLAPIFLLLGGLIVFRERFTIRQWLGLALVIGGMALFFNQCLAELLRHLSAETIGVLLVVASGIAWATYGLAQKQLLRSLSSAAIMFVIYAVGTVAFLPLARPAHIFELSGMHLVLLAFCALNTLLAYGAFAEALDHWEASRVSAVLASIPIMTILAVRLISSHWPSLAQPEDLGVWNIVGALVVVAGSMLTALSDSPQR
jgi:drug/metabolite transporter (DMT)-like permease